MEISTSPHLATISPWGTRWALQGKRKCSQVVELRAIVQCMTGDKNTDHGAPSALLNV